MAAMLPPISVVIPTCQGERWLPDCLDSLQRQTLEDCEIIVVDNSVGEATPRLLAERYPQVRLVKFDRPLGFARPVNAGLSAARADLIFLLNDDTVCAVDCLEELLRAAREHPEHDFFAARMVYHEAPEVINSAGHDLRRDGAVVDRGQGRPASEYGQAAPVLGACGGAVLYRRELLATLSGFDEDFYITHEDADLDLRALLHGFTCLYWPAAEVRHRVSQSLDPGTAFSQFHLTTTLALFLLKDLPPAYWRRHGLRAIAYLARSAAALARRAGLARVPQAAWRVVALAPRALRQRRRTFALLCAHEAEILAWIAPQAVAPPVGEWAGASPLTRATRVVGPSLAGLLFMVPWLVCLAWMRLGDGWAALIASPRVSLETDGAAPEGSGR